MIEAVNSVISNAQQARFSADQVATLNSFAANTKAVESVARGPVAPYISPYVSVDTRFDTAVLQIRDSDTGDILTQFPSEATLEQRRTQAARQEAASAEVERATVRSSAERSSGLDVSATAFQAQQVAQSTPAQSVGGPAQAAVAALSAGAQSGQGAAGTVNVTA